MTGKAFFVTGTDTGVGKTMVAARLMHALRGVGHQVLAMKPVAAGCDSTPAGLRNEDVEVLRAAASFLIERELMNPYAFQPAIAPHLAAAQAGVEIDFALLKSRLDDMRQRTDIVIVEGAGGWYAPLSATTTMADLARACDLPVVLVVGLRLGCLNHALLTAEAILRSDLPLRGWIANFIDPHMAQREGNMATLTARLPCPLLGVVPYIDDPAAPLPAEPSFELAPLLR